MIEGVVLGDVARGAAAAGCGSSRPGRRRDRRDQGDVVQPALARGAAHARARACGCAASRTATASRSRATTSARSTETADYAPVYPASEALAQKQLRALVGEALALARAEGDPLPGARSPPPSGCRCAPTRSSRCTGRARPRRPRRAAGGSPSTSCSCSSSRSRAAPPSASGSSPRRCRPPGELLRALPRGAAVHPHRRARSARSRRSTRDLARTTPMQRLLQGDVGSGKTVVALATLLRAVEAGRQGALMAPTEVLAEQHFLTIEGICAELGVRVALLTSALGAKEHANVRQLIASGDVQIAVGTHALIQKEVGFRDLAVAVVDEQHRFGVEQRSALAEGRSPHVLHMTATPIPRTLALTVYGDLSVSEITAPPANRKPIVTAWVTDDRSAEAYERLTRHLADGPPGLRRLPADRGVGDDRRARRRGRGRAAAPGRAEGLPRRLPARAAEARRAPRDHGRLQGGRDRRARRDDGDRGRRRRPERDDHDRPGGRPLRPRAAPPAARPRRAWGGAVVLPARLAARRRS